MKLKVGDKVRIRKDSEYYGTDEHVNPADKDGIIKTVFPGSEYCYEVLWNKRLSYSNTYRPKDLILSETSFDQYSIY